MALIGGNRKSVDRYALKEGERLRLTLFKGDVRNIEVLVDDGIPFKVGESFTCTVVSVTREVTERG